MNKVIGMFSGGLDSILAARIMKDMGLDVMLLHFYNGFNEHSARETAEGPGTWWTPRESVVRAAENIGAKLVPVDVTGDFLPVLLHPRFGYGSALNPCIDCRIFLLSKAREIMEREGAVCVFTGEVLGQRPMSQHRPALGLVDKHSGLKGRLLRPLSARLLDPTIPEQEGIIDRDRLHDINGRSRKRQQELAASFGIDDYPQSGGGCLLTEKNFDRKYHDIHIHSKGLDITRRDLDSFKTGRHIRLPQGAKLVMGRLEAENLYLEKLFAEGAWRFDARDHPGTTVFVTDDPREDEFPVIAAICARYGKGRDSDEVTVVARKDELVRELTVEPARQEDFDSLIIR